MEAMPMLRISRRFRFALAMVALGVAALLDSPARAQGPYTRAAQFMPPQGVEGPPSIPSITSTPAVKFAPPQGAPEPPEVQPAPKPKVKLTQSPPAPPPVVLPA